MEIERFEMANLKKKAKKDLDKLDKEGQKKKIKRKRKKKKHINNLFKI